MVLPVLDQVDGSQSVPVFTSEERLGDALPNVLSYRLAPLGRLAADWPDEELQLVIDPGHSDALALTAEGIRTLLSRHCRESMVHGALSGGVCCPAAA